MDIEESIEESTTVDELRNKENERVVSHDLNGPCRCMPCTLSVDRCEPEIESIESTNVDKLRDEESEHDASCGLNGPCRCVPCTSSVDLCESRKAPAEGTLFARYDPEFHIDSYEDGKLVVASISACWRASKKDS